MRRSARRVKKLFSRVYCFSSAVESAILENLPSTDPIIAMDSPLVNVVVPVYNEAPIIEATLVTLTTFLKKQQGSWRYRIMVVDNASTDGTSELVRAFAAQHPEVTLRTLAEKGKGCAIRAGWEEEGDVLSFMDADLSSDLSYFPRLVESVVSHKADLAIGNRLGKQSVIVSSKRGRKIASRIYNTLARLFLRTNIEDHQCGFKAISRSAYDAIRPHLTDQGFFFDTELIAWARKLGYSIMEFDIRWIDSPVSKVALFSDSFKMFGDIVRLAWRIRT